MKSCITIGATTAIPIIANSMIGSILRFTGTSVSLNDATCEASVTQKPFPAAFGPSFSTHVDRRGQRYGRGSRIFHLSPLQYTCSFYSVAYRGPFRQARQVLRQPWRDLERPQQHHARQSRPP